MAEPSDDPTLDAACQPYDKAGRWKLEMKVTDIGGIGPLRYGHTGVYLTAPDGRSVIQFHGYNKDPLTGAAKPGESKGDLLALAAVPGSWAYFEERNSAGSRVLAEGSYEEMKPKLKVLFAASQALDAESLEYKGWGLWAPGQNCNTAARMVTRLLGQDTDPQKISDVILTGSERSIPLSRLDTITNSASGVDVSKLEQALLDMARDTSKSVVLPDLDQLVAQPLAAQCHSAKREIGAVAYNTDGTQTPTTIKIGVSHQLRQPPDYKPQ